MTKSRIAAISICIILLFSGAASAKQLSVSKSVSNTGIQTGDSVTISLEFENPFNKSIPLTIQDDNILGNNGLKIQCYEYELPDRLLTKVAYDTPIVAYSAGEFTLNEATITYTNPETGKQESVFSRPINVSIKQGPSNGEQQGITQIYSCGGVSMRSTSVSSSGSSSISISSGSQQGAQANTPSPSPDNIQQGAQDMQNVKQEMERQQQEKQEMEKELKERIENNSEFRDLANKLQKQDYEPAGQEINAESNDTGNFRYEYKKGDETANISGRMNAGDMQNILKRSAEDTEKLEEYIENNKTFKQMNRTLSDKGYALTKKNIDMASNISRFEYSYADQKGRNASITGNVTSAGKIKDISMNEPEMQLPYWLLPLLILPVAAIYLYSIYSRFKNNKPHPEPAKEIIYLDPKEKAMSMLDKAVELFDNGMQKDAYAAASKAVRYYLKGTSGITELTTYEIIRSMGRKDEGYVNDVRECLRLCDMVKFAKYEPNPEDFNRVVESARRIIE